MLLSAYQLWVLAMMLATYGPDGSLWYRELLWVTGKGASKTMCGAVAVLVHMDIDRYVRGGTIIPVICHDQEQAKDTMFRDIGMRCTTPGSDSVGTLPYDPPRTPYRSCLSNRRTRVKARGVFAQQPQEPQGHHHVALSRLTNTQTSSNRERDQSGKAGFQGRPRAGLVPVQRRRLHRVSGL